jgi:hypothetical protein
MTLKSTLLVSTPVTIDTGLPYSSSTGLLIYVLL